jgi:hypothetical protein
MRLWERDRGLKDPRGQILWTWSWPWPRRSGLGLEDQGLALIVPALILVLALRVLARHGLGLRILALTTSLHVLL